MVTRGLVGSVRFFFTITNAGKILTATTESGFSLSV